MVEFTKQTGHKAQILTHDENGVIQTFLKQQDLLYTIESEKKAKNSYSCLACNSIWNWFCQMTSLQ